jgi:pyruvate kinase
MMDRIAIKTEQHLALNPPSWDWQRVNSVNPIQDAIGHATFRLCKDLNACAIVTFSVSGGTALYLSKSRPFAPILAFTGNADASRRMRLFWGVHPVLEPGILSKDDLIAHAGRVIKTMGLDTKGNPVVVVTGAHFGHLGATNTIEVVTPAS